jgi:dolichyl-diphosphooligosaccharide--protein glycosyltransferase
MKPTFKKYGDLAKQFIQPPAGNPRSGSRDRILTLVLCALVFMLGFWVRFDEFRLWQKFPAVFFYEGQPTLANGDGYYYLRMARDLVQKRYQAVDELKKYPDHSQRPFPPPLISAMAAGLSQLSAFSLEWIAIFMPVILGPLLILPLYGLYRCFGGSRIMGISVALFAVLSVQYVNRTRIGFYDTDCLNVSFALAVTYLFMRFGIESRRRRYFYFLAASAVVGLFLWHWDQVPHVVLAISLIPLIIAIIFFYRPSRKEGLVFGTACLIGLVLWGVWYGISGMQTLFSRSQDFFYFLTSDQPRYFPTTLSEVRELKVPDLGKLVALTVANSMVLVLCAAGLCGLILANSKKSLFLVMPAVLAGLTFFLGHRFVIFFAPLTALGFGYLVDVLWQRISHQSWLKTGLVATVLVCAWPAYSTTTTIRYSPAIMNFLPGIKGIADLTPANAVVWTTWDVGNPLMYYARRKTVCDAQFPEGDERHILAYLPLASDQPRFVANFVPFFVKNGLKGVQKVFQLAGNNPSAGIDLIRSVLSEGPSKAREVLNPVLASQTKKEPWPDMEAWLHFFFPQELPPIYLLLHKDLTNSQGWFLLGNWYRQWPSTYRPLYQPYAGMRAEGAKIVFAGGKFEVSGPKAGLFQLENSPSENSYPISQLRVRDRQNTRVTPFNHKSRLSLEVYAPHQFGALMDTTIAASTFNRLFIRHDLDAEYFQLIAEKLPDYQIWQIRGDQL